MPTAIVRAFTEDGFILAADGRELEEPSKRIICDHRQKIFQIGDSPIARCAMGMTLLGDIREATLETVLFDFNKQLAECSLAVVASKFSRIEDFAWEVCTPIYERLFVACSGGRVDLSFKLGGVGPGETILTVFFDGFVGKEANPGSACVRFFHENGVPREPELTKEPLGVYRYGSELVETKMVTGTRFDKYKVKLEPRSVQHSDKLNRMIQASVSFIAACSSDEAKALDPNVCVSIGGHIHVARITPRVGFRWVNGYEPITSSPTASSPPSPRSGSASLG